MCGIVGWIGPLGFDPKAGVAALKHRGPNGHGVWSETHGSLGHTRLSIIDLSANSDQPMVDSKSGDALIYNGEIYNYLELRQELVAHGVRFETAGDTEVLLKGLQHYGASFCDRLNGMYAFVFWNARDGRYYVGRDSMGIKPLVYARPGAGLLFASEAKALFPYLDRISIDRTALASYLSYHFVLAPRTMYHQIRQFPAGAIWAVDTSGNVCRTHAIQPTVRPSGVPLAAIMEAAVRRQLRADVPVGLFLSGGLDSGTLAALTHSVHGPGLQAFTTEFEEGESSELALAEGLGNRLGFPVQAVRIREGDAFARIPEMSWANDAPLGEGGCIPNYLMSEAAKKKVTVVLAGEGADELFGGYPWAPVLPRLHLIASRGSKEWKSRAGHVRAIACEGNLAKRYLRMLEVFPHEQVERSVARPDRNVDGPQANVLELDQTVILRDCYLRKADAMTMAHSLEERVPYLDTEVVGAANAASWQTRVRRPGKMMLRRAAPPTLPADVRRRRKRGFGTPMRSYGKQATERLLADGLQSLQDTSWFRKGGVDDLALGLQGRGLWDLPRGWLLFALNEWNVELARKGIVVEG